MKLYEAGDEDPFVTYAIAMEHETAGDTAAAIGWLDKTLATDPDHAYCYYQKGRLLLARGLADEARVALEAGLDAAKRSGDDKALSELRQLLGTIG